jgi:hypothetical protein
MGGGSVSGRVRLAFAFEELQLGTVEDHRNHLVGFLVGNVLVDWQLGTMPRRSSALVWSGEAATHFHPFEMASTVLGAPKALRSKVSCL